MLVARRRSLRTFLGTVQITDLYCDAALQRVTEAKKLTEPVSQLIENED